MKKAYQGQMMEPVLYLVDQSRRRSPRAELTSFLEVLYAIEGQDDGV